MSSFVISKVEYIKAAGFFAGLAKQKNYYREPLIYWWSNSTKSILTDEDYLSAFAKMYEMNARSVALQYGDKQISHDDSNYKAEFTKYMQIAAKLYTKAQIGDIAPLKSAIYDFHNFCRSVNYQIEDPKLSAEVNKFMNKAQMFLLGLLSQVEHHESDCWGSFDIEEV